MKYVSYFVGPMRGNTHEVGYVMANDAIFYMKPGHVYTYGEGEPDQTTLAVSPMYYSLRPRTTYPISEEEGKLRCYMYPLTEEEENLAMFLSPMHFTATVVGKAPHTGVMLCEDPLLNDEPLKMASGMLYYLHADLDYEFLKIDDETKGYPSPEPGDTVRLSAHVFDNTIYGDSTLTGVRKGGFWWHVC